MNQRSDNRLSARLSRPDQPITPGPDLMENEEKWKIYCVYGNITISCMSNSDYFLIKPNIRNDEELLTFRNSSPTSYNMLKK